MPKIVNLSTLLDMPDSYWDRVMQVVRAFQGLSKTYAPGCSVTGFFNQTHYTSLAWIIARYQMYKASHIDSYKKGKKTTAEFFNLLLEIFPFMKDVELTPHDRKLVDALKDSLWVSSHPDSETDGKAMLEIIWNQSIRVHDRELDRMRELLEQAKAGEPTYLVTNSNELNLHRWYQQMKAAFPDVFTGKAIDLSVKDDKAPIKLGENLYLCTSYRFQLAKAKGQLSEPSQKTSTLIKHVATQCIGGDMNDIEVITQHDEDITEATAIGIPAENCKAPGDFYQTKEPKGVWRI